MGIGCNTCLCNTQWTQAAAKWDFASTCLSCLGCARSKQAFAYTKYLLNYNASKTCGLHSSGESQTPTGSKMSLSKDYFPEQGEEELPGAVQTCPNVPCQLTSDLPARSMDKELAQPRSARAVAAKSKSLAVSATK